MQCSEVFVEESSVCIFLLVSLYLRENRLNGGDFVNRPRRIILHKVINLPQEALFESE